MAIINMNGSPLFLSLDWDNLSLSSLTGNDSPLNQRYYPFNGNYYLDPIFRRTTNGSPASTSGTSSISAGTAGLDKTGTIFDTDNSNDTFGTAFGNIFSSGINSAGNKILNNVVKGESFLKGLDTDSLSTVAGSATGLTSNLIGQGISGMMGNSRLGKGIGQGVATGLGTVGGTVVNNLVKYGNISGKLGNGLKLIGTANKAGEAGKNLFSLRSAAGQINPMGLATSIAGTALGAVTGPSKEYNGRYGNITRTMDSVYDGLTAASNFIPGVGQAVSGFMTLNKGLSNIFGSTDGMTKTDAILGSAFMPAPVKWINMWGSSKTGTFNNQSWQNSELANSFMLNGFGNLDEKFQRAMEEAGKRYGTFSHGAKNRALRNIDFANQAWQQIMQMAAQGRMLNIRSEDMTSINNQRYSLWIQGGWNPSLVGRGKQGMKIFNNATNHNIGMRLLSGAALIDNKQMILSALNGTKMNGYISAIKRTANYNPDETIFTFPENINIIKTDAKKSKDWINWWLMNREGVLALNMKSTKEEAKKERWRQVARINPNSVQIKNTKDVKGGNIGAYTNPNTKLITFKPFVPVYKGLITHEQTHSMGDSKYLNAQTKKIQELLPKFTYTHPNDKKPNNYWNDPIEIYGRLMQFRRDNKINPKHKFTLDEIKSWYFENNGNLYGNGKMNDASNMLRFYSPETMQMLLNEVAQNPIRFNDNFNNMV